MLSPVALFVYARPDHTIKTIEALAKNRLASETEIFIFSDGAKTEKDKENVLKVRKYINSLVNYNWFKKVSVIESEINQGLANSIISGVSKVINRYKKVIVLEDDLVTSPEFLEYMNKSLDYYKGDLNIWSISGYVPNIKKLNSYNEDVFLWYRGCSWGWATWQDRWDLVDWKVSKYNKEKWNFNIYKRFCYGGNDMPLMLYHQQTGKNNSWAIRWCYEQAKLNTFTVYPTKSLVKNIGTDGSGTHFSFTTTKFDTHLVDSQGKINIKNAKVDTVLSHAMIKKYSIGSLGSLYYFMCICGLERFADKIKNVIKVSK